MSLALAARPSAGGRRRCATVLAGVGLATFVVASPAVLAHGGEVKVASRVATGMAAAPSAERVRLDLPTCRRSVEALLVDDLGRVSTGGPDLGMPQPGTVAAVLGESPPAMVTVRRLEGGIAARATTDLINVYALDVSALLVAYRAVITAACTGELGA